MRPEPRARPVTEQRRLCTSRAWRQGLTYQRLLIYRVSVTATQQPVKDTQRAVALFHALSDPTRMQILECLASCERCVCDLTGALDAAQSRLSFHLKVLKEAGIISDRRSGRWVYYALNAEALDEAAAYLSGLRDRSMANDSNVCCG